MFTYKGYTGRVEIDEEANLLHGNVTNTRDVITFQGETVEQAKQAFQKSIDEYLKFCEENDREPDKPFSGQFMQRISPELHRAATAQAAAANMSLNAWVENLISRGIQSKTSVQSQSNERDSLARKVVRRHKKAITLAKKKGKTNKRGADTSVESISKRKQRSPRAK